MDDFIKYNVKEAVRVGLVVGAIGFIVYHGTKTPEPIEREPIIREGVITNVYENMARGKYSLEVASLDSPATTRRLSALKMHGGINIQDLSDLELAVGDTIKYGVEPAGFLSASDIKEIRRQK